MPPTSQLKFAKLESGKRILPKTLCSVFGTTRLQSNSTNYSAKEKLRCWISESALLRQAVGPLGLVAVPSHRSKRMLANHQFNPDVTHISRQAGGGYDHERWAIALIEFRGALPELLWSEGP